MKVLELANDLGLALAGSDEFIRLKKAEAAQNNDQEAQKLLMDYNQLRNNLGRIVADENPDEERMTQMRQTLSDQYEILLSNDTVKESLEAQKIFNELMQKVNTEISAHINPGCGSGCSSCSGCH